MSKGITDSGTSLEVLAIPSFIAVLCNLEKLITV